MKQSYIVWDEDHFRRSFCRDPKVAPPTSYPCVVCPRIGGIQYMYPDDATSYVSYASKEDLEKYKLWKEGKK